MTLFGCGVLGIYAIHVVLQLIEVRGEFKEKDNTVTLL
jgi:hypothetical protein